MEFSSFNSALRIVFSVAVACTLCASSCNKDNEDNIQVNPTISFLSDSGYTYQSDTLPLSDTILVRVVIRKGDDDLRTFMTERKYDQHSAMVVDSLSVDSAVFEFEKQIIMRDVAGIEKYNFIVIESDGDNIRRSLTFVVQ